MNLPDRIKAWRESDTNDGAEVCDLLCEAEEELRRLHNARRNYAQAWVDGSGRPLDAVQFTAEFLRAEVRGAHVLLQKITESLNATMLLLGDAGFDPIAELNRLDRKAGRDE